MTTNTQTPELIDVDADTLQAWLREGNTRLIDVREPFEHVSEHIADSQLQPLSTFDSAAVQESANGHRVVFYCRTGRRSADAARLYQVALASQAGNGPAELYHLAGGITAWKAAGLPVERSAGAPPIDVMRQVQIAAGSLVLLGTLLGLVNPWFLAISGFVGAGLMFAGLSGTCGMAILLSRMPWNRSVRGITTCTLTADQQPARQ